MADQKYWIPGSVLPQDVTDVLRAGPTALRHHHVVCAAHFTGVGHAGVILSQYNTVEWVVWRVDVYGKPELLDVTSDKDHAHQVFSERVVEHSMPFQITSVRMNVIRTALNALLDNPGTSDHDFNVAVSIVNDMGDGS